MISPYASIFRKHCLLIRECVRTIFNSIAHRSSICLSMMPIRSI
ncbi:Uncharacterised protein [Vibrio cholerae]|nr:Uncharacterised protein [Vibrio cholerae]